MAFIPTPNAAVATLKYSVSGRIVTSNLSWLGATPFDTAACADLAGAMRDAWAELIAPMFSPAYTLTTISVVAQDSPTAAFFDLSIAADNVGTNTGDTLSLNVCGNVGLKTDTRGRSYRGLLKHPCMFISMLVSKRRWAVASIQAVASNYADYVDAVVAAATGAPQNVVISREVDGLPRIAGVATPVTFYQGYERVGSISRRTA